MPAKVKAPQQSYDIAYRVRWYIKIRWFLLLTIGATGLVSQIADEGISTNVKHGLILSTIALSSNLVFYLLLRPKNNTNSYYRKIGVVVLALDLILVSLLIYLKGGIESRSVILYVVPILMSAAILGKRPAYTTSGIAAFLYSSLIAGDFFGLFEPLGIYTPELHTRQAYVVETVLFFSAILIIVGASVDFMTRLLLEKESQVSENLDALKLAQSIAHIGSWEWQVKSERLIWSDEMHKILGVSKRQTPTGYDDYLKHVHPDDRNAVQQQVATATKTKRAYSVDHRVILPSGGVKHIHSEGRPVKDSHGKLIKIVGTIQDITEAKMLDEAKSDFVALASHQLRTPATGVKQYLGMLLNGFAGKLNEQQKSLTKTAYESNERQLSIVDDLLSIAKVDSGKLNISPMPIDLVRLLAEVADEQTQQFESTGQNVLLRTRYKKLYCSVDQYHLRMILENLVDNAHKYSPENEPIIIRLSKTNEEINITTIDKGVGIATSDMPKLFRKFSRIDNKLSRKVGGTGLGLYWAAQLAEINGWKVSAESKLGYGSKFTITIPPPEV